jgi:hypothetical protein
LDAQLENILGKEPLTIKKIFIVLSQGPCGHYKGDAYFYGLSNVKLVNSLATDVRLLYLFY